jgi:hypothetical protein
MLDWTAKRIENLTGAEIWLFMSRAFFWALESAS